MELINGSVYKYFFMQKEALENAAANIGYKNIVGGEMEASGVYYACQRHKNRQIPFMVIKGICDWGAVKNGWEEVIGSNYSEYHGDTIKDCIQAYSCENAFKTLCYILKHLNFNLSNRMSVVSLFRKIFD